MNNKNPQVDGYIRKHKDWQPELEALREIILACPLVEEVKWRVPCYTADGRNIVFVNALKEACCLSFVKGALLNDAKGILVKPGEDTQSGRTIRFADAGQITKLASTLQAFIREAIAIEKAGLKVPLKKIAERPLPDELEKKFEKMPDLKAAFRALTPGRQRAYLIHFSSAKQSATREGRIEKCVLRILDGKGMDD